MRTRRRMVLGLGLALGGCSQATICCTLDGNVEIVGEAACLEQGGADVALYVCDGVGDPDVDPTPDDPVAETREQLCEDFCAAEQTACPTDDACLHSCLESCPSGPTASDVTCAEDAVAAGATCQEFGADWLCWTFCSG